MKFVWLGRISSGKKEWEHYTRSHILNFRNVFFHSAKEFEWWQNSCLNHKHKYFSALISYTLYFIWMKVFFFELVSVNCILCAAFFSRCAPNIEEQEKIKIFSWISAQFTLPNEHIAICTHTSFTVRRFKVNWNRSLTAHHRHQLTHSLYLFKFIPKMMNTYLRAQFFCLLEQSSSSL